MRVHHVLPAAVLALALASCGDDGDDGGPAPRDLRLSSMSATAIGLKWDDTSGNTLDHRIYRDDLGDGAGYEEIGTQDALLTSYTDDTVQAGHTYRYYVVYFDDGGEYSKQSNTVECEAAAPYVTVTAPTSSDVLLLGDQYEVLWDTNIPGFDARIYLYVDTGLGKGWELILKSLRPSSGSWTWAVGDDAQGQVMAITVPQNDCLIRVEHYEESSWSGESDPFTISSP